MITLPFLAQVTPPAAVADTLTRGQQMMESACKWAGESGPSFLAAVVAALAVYIIGTWVASVIRSLTVKALGRRGMDETFATYLANILHGLVMVLVIITALGQLGVPTAQFAALIAAAGLAIGLALQGNLANFASGFLLVFFRPFKKDDYLSAGGAEGIVEEIGLFTSTLRTLDHKRVVVPNSAITGANITNFSTNPQRLVTVPCTVAASNPVEKVRASLLSATAGNPNLLTDPAAIVVVSELLENKYTAQLRAWCPSDKYWDALFTLNEAAKAALDRDGISGPLPAMRIVQG
jgi:small conductance mechanosensitive channel